MGSPSACSSLVVKRLWLPSQRWVRRFVNPVELVAVHAILMERSSNARQVDWKVRWYSFKKQENTAGSAEAERQMSWERGNDFRLQASHVVTLSFSKCL